MKEPNIHDELKSIAPELSQMKSTEGYSVPPLYFKELQDKVLGHLQNDRQKEPVSNWLRDVVRQYFRPRYALALATVSIVIIAAVVFTGGNDASLMAPISPDDAYEYVLGNIYEYQTMDLYALVDAEETDFLLDNLSDEELNFALDALIEDIDTESLEELF